MSIHQEDYTSILRVMVGIIWDKTRTKILVSRRLEGKRFGGLWELPGGKVDLIDPKNDLWESDIVALTRELSEELGIFITDFTHWADFSYLYVDDQTRQKVDLILYDILDYEGVESGIEGQEIKWMSPSEMDINDFPRENDALFHRLKQRHHQEYF